MRPTGPASIVTDTLPADLVARFATALARLRRGEGRIGLAVSGGPDSMAMLLLAHAAIPGQFDVATVDHGLRPEARAECALVKHACDARGFACDILRVTVCVGNLQAGAREARYAALAGWAEERSLAAIATAHHADDQAETLLMRLNRGSGVAGLAGVRERIFVAQLDTHLIRPLLTFRKSELAAIVIDANIPAADDPSNRDESFERVRIRNALAMADWLDPVALARSAAYLAEAEEALAFVTARIWVERVQRDGDRIVFACDGPRAVRLRIIQRAVALLGTGDPRGADVARLLDRLEQGEGGNIGGVLVTTAKGAGDSDAGGERWIFRPEPPRRA